MGWGGLIGLKLIMFEEVECGVSVYYVWSVEQSF